MVNLQIKGYTPPSSMGYGTWTDITPSQGIVRVETERNINGGDSARITLADDDDFTNFESQRAIQIFLDGTTDPTNLIWEGFMLTSELGHHKPWPNMRTYEVQCVGYEKFLMRKDISATWDAQTFNTIFTALADEANADMRFPTTKRFKYDTSKLTNYDSDTYGSSITKTVERQKIWNALKELIPVLDGIDTTYAYEYGIYLDYMQSTSYIYLMPDMLDSTAAATTDFSDDADIYADSKTVKLNFDRVINYSHALGDGFETSHYHASPLSAVDVSPDSDNYDFNAVKATSARNYVAIEIQNDAVGNEFGSFSIDGYDAPVGNPLSEDIYFYAPFSKTTTVFSSERYGDFAGSNAFNVSNLNGSTVNVYECLHGIAGKSIRDYGICNSSQRRLDLNTQARVDNFAQQEVRLYHNPPHEATFRALNYNKTNYINKTIDLMDPFTDATGRFLVVKQKYIIPENYDVEQWLTAIDTDYDWE